MEMNIIAITTTEKLLLTNGKLPKKYPPNEQMNTHKIPPIMLNEMNLQ